MKLLNRRFCRTEVLSLLRLSRSPARKDAQSKDQILDVSHKSDKSVRPFIGTKRHIYSWEIFDENDDHDPDTPTLPLTGEP